MAPLLGPTGRTPPLTGLLHPIGEMMSLAHPFVRVLFLFLFSNTWEIEKAINKSGLASYGIGKYDLTTTSVIDTVRLCYVVILNNVNHVFMF